MNNALQNELDRLLPFKGVPSFDARIADLQKQLSPVGEVTPAELTAVVAVSYTHLTLPTILLV